MDFATLVSGFLAGNLEDHFDVAARVEAGNRARRRGEIAVFGMHFVIDVGIEPAETVASGIVRDASDHGLCPEIQQINDAGRDRIVVFVDGEAVNSPKLGIGFLVLCAKSGDRCRRKNPNDRESKDLAHIGQLDAARGPEDVTA